MSKRLVISTSARQNICLDSSNLLLDLHKLNVKGRGHSPFFVAKFAKFGDA
jgi:hypothetical protein